MDFERAVDMLAGVRVFVTSRERIKHPEGTDLFDEAIRVLREELNHRHGAGDAEDSARLDFLCSGRQKKIERTLSDGWFRVYQDMASIMDPEHWRAMTDQFYETAREAIDAARAGERG